MNKHITVQLQNELEGMLDKCIEFGEEDGATATACWWILYARPGWEQELEVLCNKFCIPSYGPRIKETNPMNDTAKHMRGIAMSGHGTIHKDLLEDLLEDIFDKISFAAHSRKLLLDISHLLASDRIPGSHNRATARMTIPFAHSVARSIMDVVNVSFYGPIYKALWDKGYSLELRTNRAIVDWSSEVQTFNCF